MVATAHTLMHIGGIVKSNFSVEAAFVPQHDSFPLVEGVPNAFTTKLQNAAANEGFG